MLYLTEPDLIIRAIATYQKARMLWLDTEIADFQTKKPRLSLITILDDPTDLEGEQVRIFDLLNYPEITDEFVSKIMANSQIEKVFHNAKYDLKFLGKTQAKNVSCTLELARQIPYYLLPTPDYSLKTLTEKLADFKNIDKTEQNSDWKIRPLTENQLNYAKMDVVYLAQIHSKLLQLNTLAHPIPETENLHLLTLRYWQIAKRWQLLNSEIEHLKERIKNVMIAQEINEFQGFKLINQKRSTLKTSFKELAKLTEELQLDLDLNINLTQTLQNQLEAYMEQLPIQEESSNFYQLKISNTIDDHS